MTDLTDLIARVEKLEGPTYGLMWDLAGALCGDHTNMGEDFSAFVENYAFLDAALALVERVLPRRQAVELDITQNTRAKVWNEWGRSYQVEAPTPALALILALLRALSSQDPAHV